MCKELHIFSAGQDSTFILGGSLVSRLRDKVATTNNDINVICFEYGQKHINELASVSRILGMYAETFQVTINKYPVFIDNLNAKPLNDGIKHYHDYTTMVEATGNSVESTYVPFRNLTFINHAIILAEKLGFGEGDKVFIGICANDNANYPDCTPQFLDSCNTLLKTLGVKFTLVAPLLHISKEQQILYVKQDYHLSPIYNAWAFTTTSYDGDYPPLSKNHSNLLRNESFRKARLCDPLLMRAVSDNLVSVNTLHELGFYYDNTALPDWTNLVAATGDLWVDLLNKRP